MLKRCQTQRSGALSLVLAALLSAAAPARAQSPAGAPSAPQPASASPAAKPADEPPDAARGPVEDKVACVAAFEQAQEERSAGHLLAAQKLLLTCARPVCGPTLVPECTEMYTEVERAIPSIVLSAHDADRNVDISEVEVQLDGALLTRSLDGKPVPVDPGEHELVFSIPGHPPVRRSLVIGTGDKYRQVSAVFHGPSPGPAPTSATVEREQPEASGVPVMSYVLGGLGVVGVGTFVGLRLMANSDFDALKTSCAPDCGDAQIEDLRQKYVWSNVALAAGGAAFAGAVLWYALAPRGAPTTGMAILPAVGGSGVTAHLVGSF